MTICNFCNKRESRSYTFDNIRARNFCKNKDNYITADDDIIFIDSRDKRIQITSETELDVINIHSTANNSMNTNDNALKSLIDTENFKDVLLAPLYSQVEFLRTQVVEKDLLIRSLMIKKSDIFNYESSRNVEVKNSVISNCRDVNVNESNDNILDNVNSSSPNKDGTTNLNETGDDTDDELGMTRMTRMTRC